MSRILTVMNIFTSLLIGTSAQAYYGRHSTEAILRFEAILDAPWKGDLDLAQWNQDGEVRKKAVALVQKQVIHLIGTFQSARFKKKWGGPASIGPWFESDTFTVTFLDVAPSTEKKRVRAKYRFEAKIVVQKDPLRRNKHAKMEIWFPYAPDLIYDLGVKWNVNRCTDLHDNVEDSFYYYWNPYQKGCSLLKDHPESVQFITADVERIENTRLTYPEYSALYKDEEENPTVNIAMFWGYISENIRSRRPYYQDESYQALKDVSSRLADLGYEEIEYLPKFHIDDKGQVNTSDGINVLRKMKKLIRRNGRDVTVNLTMLVADSQLKSKDRTFHHFVKPALNEADIFIYDGHSGDGDTLSPEKLGLKPPAAKKHQLFFINACDVYMNYTEKFKRARGGLGLLNMVISGTPTDAHASMLNDWTFLESFASLKTLSYQAILDRVEKSNPSDSGTFLVGVLGDEGNTWSPNPRD